MVEPEIGTGWALTMRAAERASKWHADDKHKGGREPFINHLIEVATLVTIATEGRDPALTSAAFLHDAIEKAEIEPRLIRDAFGEEVCALVLEVTDDRRLTEKERRRQQVETAARKSRKAKMLKLADKTSNLRALARHEGKEDARVYADWAEEVAKGLRGTDRWLEGQFDNALSALRQRVGRDGRDRGPSPPDQERKQPAYVSLPVGILQKGRCMMQRKEHLGRGRNRQRDEEDRFAGRRGSGWHEESRYSGARGQGWNRSQEARFGEGPYRDEGFGGEDYRGMTRGGYPDYGAGDAGWGGGYPGYGEQGPSFGRGFGPGEGYGGPGYGGPRRGAWDEGPQQGWGQGEEQEHRHQFDDDYYHWRNEQLRKFDQDYEEWRKERRKKFSEDFDKWRSARPERAEGSRTVSQADNKNK